MRRGCAVAVLSMILGGGLLADSLARIGPEQAQALLQNKETLLLDVRTEAEYRERHIPGTGALIPVQELAARLKELAGAKKRTILVYCRSGNRSLQAAAILKQNGFKNVTDLEGGILAWGAKGYPMESGAFAP